MEVLIIIIVVCIVSAKIYRMITDRMGWISGAEYHKKLLQPGIQHPFLIRARSIDARDFYHRNGKEFVVSYNYKDGFFYDSDGTGYMGSEIEIKLN